MGDQQMNVLDWIMMVVAVSGLVIGYQRGLIGQLISLAGLIIAYFAAYTYYKDFSVWVEWFIPWPDFFGYTWYGFAIKETNWEMYLNHAVAFVFIFIVVKLLCSLVGAVIQFIFKAPGLNFINKWSGALLGLGGALILIVVAVGVMGAVPSEPVQKQLNESRTNEYIQHDIPMLIPQLEKLRDEEQPPPETEAI